MNTIKATVLLLTVFSLSTVASGLLHSAILRCSGSYGIPAAMTFARNDSSYKIVSSIRVPLYKTHFESTSMILDGVLYPFYYKDIRGGKLHAEAKSNGHSVTCDRIKEGEETETASGPMMGLFTLAWQFAADDGKLPAGTRITNGKKLHRINSISKIGSSKYKFGKGYVDIDKYRVRRDDSTVGYIFVTAFDSIPAQVSCIDDSRTYNLRLTRTVIDGKPVQSQQP